MKIEIDPDDLVKREADARGRITVGSDFSNATVTIAVVEVHDSN